LAFFRKEKRWVKGMRVFRLNAAAVHAFRQAQVHRAPGDAAAARDIARFLLEHCTRRAPDAEYESGSVVFYRGIRAMLLEQAAIAQRLQALLPVVHPDLVQYCRAGFPQWVMEVLERYPTAAMLARARVETVDGIAHIDAVRARDLIEQAKVSVASLSDAATAATIRMLVGDWCDKERRIERAKAELVELIAAEPESPLARAVTLLDGIPGVGPWSAACLACEIGDPARFAHAKAIIAWSGLDPVAEASGDERHDVGISHRGNAHVRAILFPLAMSAITHNPVLKDFYGQLLRRGKKRMTALVAVMAKMLRIAFAMLVSGNPFDADYAAKCRKAAEARQAARSAAPVIAPVVITQDVAAPVSRLEAKRRKNAAAPGVVSTGSESQARSRSGRSASFPQKEGLPRVS
jgi:transposase